MAEANLNIRIGADTSQVDKAIDKLTSELGKFNAAIDRGDKDAFKNLSASLNRIQKDIKGINPQLDGLLGRLRDQTLKLSVETDTKSIEKLKADISQTQRLISGLKGVPPQVAQSFANLRQGAGQANVALTNLSRVAQDAPFGFIGIANNIDPLLQSFQSLKKETGSTGAALKSLGASLAGPAGLAVGLSVVTSLITVAIQKYGSLGNALGVLTGSISLAEQAQRGLNLAIAENEGSAQKEISSINALLSIAKDKTISDEARQQAIDSLNKEYDKYLPKLSLENINTEKTTEAVKKLTSALITQAKIRGAESYIQKLGEDLAKLRVEQAATSNQVVKSANEGFLSLAGLFIKSQFTGDIGGLTQGTKQAKELQTQIELTESALRSFKLEAAEAGTLVPGGQEQLTQLEKLQQKLDELKGKLTIETNSEQIKFLQTEIGKVETQIKKLKGEKIEVKASIKVVDGISSQDANFRILEIQNDLNADLAKAQEKSATDEREKIRLRGEAKIAELRKQYDRERQAEINKIYQNAEDKKRVLAALDNAFLRRVTTIQSEVLFETINFNKNYFDFTKNLKAKVDEQIKNKPISLSFPAEIRAKLKVLDKGESDKDLFSGITESAKRTTDVISGLLTPAFDAFFKTLSSGSGNPFKAFAQALKQMVVQMIAAITKAILLRAILSAIPGGQAFSLFGAGGALLQGLGGALGGTIGGTSAGGVSTSGIRGSAAPGSQRLVTEVRGSSLAFILQRTNQTTNRLG